MFSRHCEERGTWKSKGGLCARFYLSIKYELPPRIRWPLDEKSAEVRLGSRGRRRPICTCYRSTTIAFSGTWGFG